MYDMLNSPTIPEPISPLDPSRPRSGDTSESSTDFFEALYLDHSPFRIDDFGYESQTKGYTKPLRIRKKKSTTRVVKTVSGTRRHRRSTLSLPQSPRSPYSPCTPLSPLSTHPHQAISRLFLSLPLESPPPPITMRPLPPLPTTTRKTRSPSDLHLGLGRFAAYDETIRPGPSPPLSPAISPTKRSFSNTPRTTPPPKDRHKRLPASPMTPSKAPRKAAQLLGVSPVAPSGKTKSKRKEQYRPLPSSKAAEIDLFFGVLPKVPSKPPILKSKSSSKPQQAKSRGEERERQIGQGKTVAHVGEDGTTWLDVEEEQEFAWLMSEVLTNPAPLPLSKVGEEQVIFEEKEWGMETFTNVLAMPKPQNQRLQSINDSTSRPGWVEMTREDGRSKSRRAPDITPHPWSIQAIKSINPPTPPRPIIPPPGGSSRSPPTSLGVSPPTDPSSVTTETKSEPSSPPRLRNRPPPLTLKHLPPSRNLPMLTARLDDPPPQPTITSVRAPVKHKSSITIPDTPLTKPRNAPRIPIQPLPKSIPSMYAPAQVQWDEISYFDTETDTPVGRSSDDGVILGPEYGVRLKVKGVGGVGWLKKVVKPIVSGRI